MQRLIAALGAALMMLVLSSTALADGGGLAAGPAIGTDAPAMSLKLLDGYRETVVTTRRRVKLPQGSVQADPEAPGEALTNYVERVWSQARVYRRPGGAELILRGKF
jgi:hypothetical protein